MPMASASAQPIGTLSQMPVTPSGVARADVLDEKADGKGDEE